MKRQIRDLVIEELLCNLKTLQRGEDWKKEKPPVKEFIHNMDEESRAYHGWDHLYSMLEELNNLPSGIVQSPLRLRAAILFHDIVYKAGASDNEHESAVFAGKFYEGNNLAEITLLIGATRHEFPFVTFLDDRDVLCDLDLMNLAAPTELFVENGKNIMREYLFVKACSQKDFVAGREIFLRMMLRQSRSTGIFRTVYFKNKYEAQARHNLEVALGVSA